MASAIVVGAITIAAAPVGASGFPSETAAAELQSVIGAMRNAKSVTIVGSMSQNGLSGTLDLALTSDGGASGNITLNGQPIGIIALPSAVYIKASAAYWQSAAHVTKAEALRLASHWLKVPASVGSQVSSLSYRSLLNGLSTDNGHLTKAGSRRISGTPVVGIHSSKGGTLWVKSSSPHYPVALIGSLNGSSANVRFTRWNTTPTPVAPKTAIALTAPTQG